MITDEKGIYSSGGANSFWNLLIYLLEKYTDRQMAILASKYFAIEIDRTTQSSFVIFNGQHDHQDEPIRKAQEFIEQNFWQKITVDQLADKFAIGRRSLERRFKKATSNTVVEYIQRVKIEAAKKGFESSNKNIAEVMNEVGYNDTKAFRTIFKKQQDCHRSSIGISIIKRLPRNSFPLADKFLIQVKNNPKRKIKFATEMSLFISSINSGSNGNCYYVGNSKDAVLIDVGLSCREIEKRMLRSGLSIQKVRAIFISHEHIDHIRGVEVLSKKYNLPVYINEKTLCNGRVKLVDERVNSFLSEEIIPIGSLNVIPFFKSHDAADPHSFTVECDGIRVGVFTDIGTVCEKLTLHFSQCHAAFLEANYCEEMLAKGPYPYYLKKRISSDHGHLSNTQALDLFVTHRSEFLSHLFLAHLSKENNSPELVQELFSSNSISTKVMVASRHEESAVYRVGLKEVEEQTDLLGQFVLQI